MLADPNHQRNPPVLILGASTRSAAQSALRASLAACLRRSVFRPRSGLLRPCSGSDRLSAGTRGSGGCRPSRAVDVHRWPGEPSANRRTNIKIAALVGQHRRGLATHPRPLASCRPASMTTGSPPVGSGPATALPLPPTEVGCSNPCAARPDAEYESGGIAGSTPRRFMNPTTFRNAVSALSSRHCFWLCRDKQIYWVSPGSLSECARFMPPPFAWCGTITPLELPVETAAMITQIGDVLAQRAGLRGLFGCDFIVRPRQAVADRSQSPLSGIDGTYRTRAASSARRLAPPGV